MIIEWGSARYDLPATQLGLGSHWAMGFGVGEAVVDPDSIFGWLEYSVSGRLHYTLADGKTHYTTQGRLHYTVPDDDP